MGTLFIEAVKKERGGGREDVEVGILIFVFRGLVWFGSSLRVSLVFCFYVCSSLD